MNTEYIANRLLGLLVGMGVIILAIGIFMAIGYFVTSHSVIFWLFLLGGLFVMLSYWIGNVIIESIKERNKRDERECY